MSQIIFKLLCHSFLNVIIFTKNERKIIIRFGFKFESFVTKKLSKIRENQTFG